MVRRFQGHLVIEVSHAFLTSRKGFVCLYPLKHSLLLHFPSYYAYGLIYSMYILLFSLLLYNRLGVALSLLVGLCYFFACLIMLLLYTYGGVKSIVLIDIFVRFYRERLKKV